MEFKNPRFTWKVVAQFKYILHKRRIQSNRFIAVAVKAVQAFEKTKIQRACHFWRNVVVVKLRQWIQTFDKRICAFDTWARENQSGSNRERKENISCTPALSRRDATKRIVQLMRHVPPGVNPQMAYLYKYIYQESAVPNSSNVLHELLSPGPLLPYM